MEIVSTISAAESASSALETVPNLDFFIPFTPFLCGGSSAVTHLNVHARRRQRLIAEYADRSELHTLLVLDREFPLARCQWMGGQWELPSSYALGDEGGTGTRINFNQYGCDRIS